jgi:hypothetical protein
MIVHNNKLWVSPIFAHQLFPYTYLTKQCVTCISLERYKEFVDEIVYGEVKW